MRPTIHLGHFRRKSRKSRFRPFSAPKLLFGAHLPTKVMNSSPLALFTIGEVGVSGIYETLIPSNEFSRRPITSLFNYSGMSGVGFWGRTQSTFQGGVMRSKVVDRLQKLLDRNIIKYLHEFYFRRNTVSGRKAEKHVLEGSILKSEF